MGEMADNVGNGDTEVDMALKTATGALNRITPEKFASVLPTLQEVLPVIIADPQGLTHLVGSIISKAICELKYTDLYAKLCQNLAPEPETECKPFRIALLRQCEEKFNSLADAAEDAGVGYVKFIGELYLKGVMRGQVVHSCIVKLLYGPNTAKDFIPPPASIVMVCTLLELCGGRLSAANPRFVTTYVRQLEQLTVAGIQHRLKLRIQNTIDAYGRNWIDPSKSTKYRHDPYSTSRSQTEGLDLSSTTHHCRTQSACSVSSFHQPGPSEPQPAKEAPDAKRRKPVRAHSPPPPETAPVIEVGNIPPPPSLGSQPWVKGHVSPVMSESPRSTDQLTANITTLTTLSSETVPSTPSSAPKRKKKKGRGKALAEPITKKTEEPWKEPRSMFAQCQNRREMRQLGYLVINKSLQEAYNRTYSAARRKLTKWCNANDVLDSDLDQLVVYLNELFLAGSAYSGLAKKSFHTVEDLDVEIDFTARHNQPTSSAREDRDDEDDDAGSVVSLGSSSDEEESDTETRVSHHSGSAASVVSTSPEIPLAQPGVAFDKDSSLDLNPDVEKESDHLSGLSGSAAGASHRSTSSKGVKYGRIPEDITVEDRVRVHRLNKECHEGTVKYIGFPPLNKGPDYEGCWIGVVLDRPVGNHDGSVDGVRYFNCAPMHGVFVREDKIERLPDGVEGPMFFYPQHITKRLLRFDIRDDALKPYGFVHGDRITAKHPSCKGRIGTVVGVRHGLLYWHMDGQGITGASACRNSVEEIKNVFKQKKYRKVGHVKVHNYMSDMMAPASRRAPEITNIPEKALEHVGHLVQPEKEHWEGSLKAPTPSEGYRTWFEKILRRKKARELKAIETKNESASSQAPPS